LDGSSSTDEDGPGDVVRWSFRSCRADDDTCISNDDDCEEANPNCQDGPDSGWRRRYTAAGRYTITLRVYDKDDGVGARQTDGTSSGESINTAKLKLRVVEEAAAPVVSVITPREADVVRGTITIRLRLKGDFPIDTTEFYVDQRLIGSAAGEPTFPWDSTTVADGAHEITARAYDTPHGVVGISDPVTVVVENHQPPE
jgi:hypothetical protein